MGEKDTPSVISVSSLKQKQVLLHPVAIETIRPNKEQVRSSLKVKLAANQIDILRCIIILDLESYKTYAIDKISQFML